MELSQSIINRTYRTTTGEGGYSICDTLNDNGFEAWWVGGAVRNMFMKLVPTDIDIATDATPEDIERLFNKSDSEFKDIGAMRVSVGGCTYEITSFRKEHELSDGRFPQSIDLCSRDEDASRRDFTVNAIYFNPISKEIFDPYNGKIDLKEKVVQFIGDPDTRIAHDALRLLRAVRLRSDINGQYHPETYKALHSAAESISILSGFRRFQEVEKMLKGPHPEIAFEDLWELDILQDLIPELHACKGVAQPSQAHKEGDVWNHTMLVVSSFTDDHGLDTRLAALLHDIGKPATYSIDEDRIRFNNHASVGAGIAETVLERLQCPRKRIEKVSWLIAHHMMMGTFFEIDDERKSHWYYHPWFIELLQVFWLDIAGTEGSTFEMYDEIIQDYNTFLDRNPKPQKPILSGDDIMEYLGIQPGEEVGRILKELSTLQIEKKIQTKKEAYEHIDKNSSKQIT